MILGLENRPQTVSQLASQSHMFYISGGKSIDKNISYWFIIECCFLVTQWLMIILFFDPEGHMSYSLTPGILFPSRLKVLIKLAWIQFHHLHLRTVLVSWSSLFTEFLCLVSHSAAVLHFWKPCLSSLSRQVHFVKPITRRFVFLEKTSKEYSPWSLIERTLKGSLNNWHRSLMLKNRSLGPYLPNKGTNHSLAIAMVV